MRSTAPYRQTLAPSSSAPPPRPGFTAADARNVWRAARQRVLDDECVDEDLAVYDDLRSLHLECSWNERLFGIVSASMGLPWQLRDWPTDDFRLVLPLVNPFGHVVNVLGISLRGIHPRTQRPWNSETGSLLFANEAAVLLLLSPESCSNPIVFTRGVDNYLSVASATALPVLAVQDHDATDTALVPPLRGCDLLLALDNGNPTSPCNLQMSQLALEFGVKRVFTLPLCSPAHDPHSAVKLQGLASLDWTAVIPGSSPPHTFEASVP